MEDRTDIINRACTRYSDLLTFCLAAVRVNAAVLTSFLAGFFRAR